MATQIIHFPITYDYISSLGFHVIESRQSQLKVNSKLIKCYGNLTFPLCIPKIEFILLTLYKPWVLFNHKWNTYRPYLVHGLMNIMVAITTWYIINIIANHLKLKSSWIQWTLLLLYCVCSSYSYLT